jgi:hypothetical protein
LERRILLNSRVKSLKILLNSLEGVLTGSGSIKSGSITTIETEKGNGGL